MRHLAVTHYTHRPDESLFYQYIPNRHHYRHKHKHEILDQTFFSDRPIYVSLTDGTGLNDRDSNEPTYKYTKDRHNMSNDQFGELKDKKLQHWPIKREAVIEGDLVLGGLMMVHERSDDMTCGPVMPQGGVQALETMLYTLDIINHKVKLIPGVVLGAHVLDDCDKDTYGLEMAVDFIKGTYCMTNQLCVEF